VEEHADTSDLYAIWFTQHDFVVSVARSAAQALAKGAADRPDVVVAELMIPGGGLHLIERLRTLPATADAVLIVLTTQNGPSLRRGALEAGADVFLSKPCGGTQLGNVIAAASLARRRPRPVGGAEHHDSEAAIRHSVQRSEAIRQRVGPDSVE
jgi:DNA-binding response OmpR family regulator